MTHFLNYIRRHSVCQQFFCFLLFYQRHCFPADRQLLVGGEQHNLYLGILGGNQSLLSSYIIGLVVNLNAQISQVRAGRLSGYLVILAYPAVKAIASTPFIAAV